MHVTDAHVTDRLKSWQTSTDEQMKLCCQRSRASKMKLFLPFALSSLTTIIRLCSSWGEQMGPILYNNQRRCLMKLPLPVGLNPPLARSKDGKTKSSPPTKPTPQPFVWPVLPPHFAQTRIVVIIVIISPADKNLTAENLWSELSCALL